MRWWLVVLILMIPATLSAVPPKEEIVRWMVRSDGSLLVMYYEQGKHKLYTFNSVESGDMAGCNEVQKVRNNVWRFITPGGHSYYYDVDVRSAREIKPKEPPEKLLKLFNMR